MAGDKNTNSKKVAEKKNAAKKKSVNKADATKKNDEKKVSDLINKPIEEVKQQNNDIEVVNGDPSVIAPIEPTADDVVETVVAESIEKIVEAPIKEAEKAETSVKKIIKKINRSFGYLWNGQAIDF